MDIRKKSYILIITLSCFIISLGAFLTGFSKDDSATAYAYSSRLYNKELTSKEKLEDFRYLYKIVDENYPYFQVVQRKTGYDWRKQKKEFEAMITSTKDDMEYYLALNKIVSLMQNGHTHILDPITYQEFKKVYCDRVEVYMDDWSSVLKNKMAVEKYPYWYTVLSRKYSYYGIPILFRYIEGKYAVIDDGNLREQNSIEEGDILIKVNGRAIDEYVSSLTDKYYLQYDEKRKKLNLPTLYLDTEGPAEMELTLMGAAGEYEVKVKSEMGANFYANNNGEAIEKRENLELIKLEDKKVAYIYVASMDTLNEYSDRMKIYDFLCSVKDYPYLIIDIRGNGGGSTNYWINNLIKPLIKEEKTIENYVLLKGGSFSKRLFEGRFGDYYKYTYPIDNLPSNNNYPKEVYSEFKRFVSFKDTIVPANRVDFNGKIYLLVDGYVYSAAESFAVCVKSMGFATLVGTCTGGDGLSMDPGLIMLPNSGLIMRFPWQMALNDDGTCNEETHTTPQVYVEQSLQDYLSYRKEGMEGKINEANRWEKRKKYDSILKKTLEIIKQDMLQ